MLESNRRIKTADGIKVTNQLTVRWVDYPGLSGGPNVITGVLINESKRQWAVTEKET